jgi:hypothetical protein
MPVILDRNDPGVHKMIGRVRTFLKDFTHKNRLIVGEESSDDEIMLYLEMAIDDFNNAHTPRTNYGLKNFPSFVILLWGTAIQALTSESILQIRNELNYSDGGITVALSNKAPGLAAAAQGLMVNYERKIEDLKKQLNAEQAYGNVSSEYGTVEFFF